MMKSIILAFMFVSSSAHAGRGGMVGNGGDAVLQEFNLRGLQLAAYFKSNPLVAKAFAIDAVKFQTVIKETELSGQEHLILQGVEVDAINYPSESRIEVSRTRWKESSQRDDSYFVQRRIALHEYLWVYGIDDTGYAVSNQIIAELEKASGPILDHSIRVLLHDKLCSDGLDSYDYVALKNLVSWGLDLNETCYSKINPGGIRQTPLAKLYGRMWSSTSRDQYLSLIRKMLEFGADPNGLQFNTSESRYKVVGWLPLLVQPAGYGEVGSTIIDLLFEFGADPNRIDVYGYSTFAMAAGQKVGNTIKMSADVFNKFIAAGGDVNLSGSQKEEVSAARALVSKEENNEVVEALIKTGKTDWCTRSTVGAKDRAIDVVLPEYASLLETYGVKCAQ